MGCGSSTSVQTDNKSKMNRLKNLITCNDLKGLYEVGSGKLQSNYRILEAAMTPDGKADYDKGHVPNAIFFDLTKGVESSKLYPKKLPEKEKFAEYVGSLGISNNNHVIVYDRSPFGVLAAPRVWWLFRLYGHNNISVLNGGFTKWNAEKNTLSTETPTYEKQNFNVKDNPSLIRSYDDMMGNLEKKTAQVVDARPNEDFTGSAPTKVPEGKLGHMPFATNIPHTDMVNKTTGLLKSKEEILDVFNKKNIDLNKPLILYCLTSITACTVNLAATECGHENVPIYTGSWFEWSQRAPEDKCVKE